MLSFFRYLWKYMSLYNLIGKYVNEYQSNHNHDYQLLDQIISQINNCGPVAIKLAQWMIPKIELMISNSEDIQKNIKHECTSKLENLYENCRTHDISITKDIYKQSFNMDYDDDYQSLDILGSGSIGQVHLIQDKRTLRKYVMKIIHPNVRDDINHFNQTKQCQELR